MLKNFFSVLNVYIWFCHSFIHSFKEFVEHPFKNPTQRHFQLNCGNTYREFKMLPSWSSSVENQKLSTSRRAKGGQLYVILDDIVHLSVCQGAAKNASPNQHNFPKGEINSVV